MEKMVFRMENYCKYDLKFKAQIYTIRKDIQKEL